MALVRIPLAGAATDSQSEAAFAAISELRSDYVPAAFAGVPDEEVLVGGDTAFVTDFFDGLRQLHTVIVLFVLGLSFLLLTVVFRSMVLRRRRS